MDHEKEEKNDGQESDEQNQAEQIESQTQQIIETGSITMTKGKHLIHCLTVIGQIEGHFILPPQNKTTKYEHVIPQIVAIEEDPTIEGLLIILNTVGGDVEAGLAIAELIAGMKKPTVSLVLGGGHSIGVPLAVSARKSYIVSSATMTIHPVRMNGLIVGVPQTLSYFDKMQERIIKFVTENSHITAQRFRDLMMKTGELVMDVGSVLDGENAVKEGLIDGLGGLSDAVNCLYEMIEEEQRNNPPEDEAENDEGGSEDQPQEDKNSDKQQKEKSKSGNKNKTKIAGKQEASENDSAEKNGKSKNKTSAKSKNQGKKRKKED